MPRKRSSARRRKPTARRSKTRRTSRRKVTSKVLGRQLMFKNVNHVPIPEAYFTKLGTTISLNLGTVAGQPFSATGVMTYPIKLNNIYQPFATLAALTGVAILPGFSNIQSARGINTFLPTSGVLYRLFQVLGAKLTVSVQPSSSGDQIMTTITPTASVGNPANCGGAGDQPWTKSMITRPYAGSQYKMSSYIPIAKFLGLKKSVYANDTSGEFAGEYNGGAPVTPLYFQVCHQMLDGQQNVAQIPLTIDIEYYVKFWGFTGAQLG